MVTTRASGEDRSGFRRGRLGSDGGEGTLDISVPAGARPRRRRWFTLAAVAGIAFAAYTSGASSRDPVDSPAAAAQAGPAATATGTPELTPAATAAPTPTLEPTASPTATPAPAPTPTDVPAPTATLAPPPPDPVSIGFATGYRGEGTDARLVGKTALFTSGNRIAWRMAVPQGVVADEVRVIFTASADGRVVREFILDAPASDTAFYGESVYVKRPGLYVMRTYADDRLIGEGSFRVEAAPDPTPRPTARPTPRPTPTPRSGGGGGGGGDCDRQSYPGVCIPHYPPDINCGDLSFTNFKVRQPDPHGFDGDGDGIGCES